ncbi:OmpH family outer membrane protein [Roseospira visakhapatnamensis]|nr:OmpH family outer membrane protein [Roseospira visakhapatnamensis]
MVFPMRVWRAWRAAPVVGAMLLLALMTGPLLGPETGPLVGVRAAQAQDAFPNQAIGIIDMQRILRESTAARSVDRERQVYLEAYNKETAAAEQALREKQRELTLGAGQQPTPEDEQKARDFRQQVADFERRVAERRRNLERALSQALAQVQQMITVVADEVAAERGINLVLYRSQVPLFDPRMEMTEDVLGRLNERLPAVAFPDPASLPPAGGAQ